MGESGEMKREYLRGKMSLAVCNIRICMLSLKVLTSCPACLVFWSSFFEKGIKTTLSSLSQYHLAYRPNVSEKDATRSFAHTFKLTCFFFHVCLFVFFKFLGKLCKYRKTTNITFETVLSESVDVKRQAHCTFFSQYRHVIGDIQKVSSIHHLQKKLVHGQRRRIQLPLT